MSQNLKKKVYKALGTLIIIFPITILLYLFFSDFGNFGNLFLLTRKLFFEIILGLFLISIGYLFRYMRWRLIISCFGFYPSLKADSKIWLASYSFTATPGKIGELMRCFFLQKKFNIPLKNSFLSIFSERFFDLISVIIFAAYYFFINHKKLFSIQEKNLVISLLLIVILTFSFKVLTFNYKKLFKYFPDIKINFLGNVIKFRDIGKINNLNKLFKLNILIKIIFLSLFSWGLEGIAFFIILKKSNFDVSLLTSTFIHTTSGLLGALTMLPGGLGSTEAITVYILKFQTVPIDYGIPITSIIRLMTLWYITLLGIIALISIKKDVFKDE